MRRLISRLLLVLIIAALLIGIVLTWMLHAPVNMVRSPLEVEVPAGSSMRQAARQVAAAGIEVSPILLEVLARASGQAHRVKAGSYEFVAGANTLEILDKLVRGDATQGEFALIEGWTFQRMRAEIAKLSGLKQEAPTLSDAELLSRIGAKDGNAEGLFFPDTYFYATGGSDLALYRRAYLAMQRRLAEAWAARDASVPLASPYEALIMASLVEKETGVESDRPNVASVFYNRLSINMPLQTDPSVIYGMGERFDGNLRRADLTTDTPYNTYTRRGFPPTPIAMPGPAALRAVLNPPRTNYLYFVARGDGSSEFSRNLEEHNRAVARYQKRGRK
ncbi:endolytic transglycosylase MltG [Niveibacterium sp. SC-1]|uniref:endolytic transglycosylase MltG n=1 Tax=Niveibacterium sp. SC-1 TaxID=3135646 RepID=UPI00311FF3E6